MKQNRLKCFLAFLACWLLQHNLQAQSSFELSLDRLNSTDQANVVLELQNGNVLLVGHTQNGVNNNSQRDGFVVEMNPSTGAIEWSRAYGWNNNDQFSTAIQAADGSIVLGGFANQIGNTNNRDMWFLRIESTGPNRGNVLASGRFNNTSRSDISQIVESAEQDVNGASTFLLTGPSANFQNVYVARVDENAGMLWSNTYSASTHHWTYAILENPANSNNIFISGTKGIGSHRAILLELTATGTVVNGWEYEIVNAFSPILDDIHLTPQGTIVGSGHVHLGSAGSNNTRPFLMELDPASPTSAMVVNSFSYSTTNNMLHRINNFKPILNNGVLEGYIANITSHGSLHPNEQGKIAWLDASYAVNSYTQLNNAPTITEVIPLTDGTFLATGSDNQGRAYAAKTMLSAYTPCSDTLALDSVRIGVRPFSVNFTRTARSTATNTGVPADNAIVWEVASSCCGALQATVSNDTTICAGNSVALSVTAQSGVGGLGYLWSTGATLNTILVSPNTTTMYMVTITDTITQCQVVDTVWVNINNPVVSISGTDSICAGADVSLTASASYNGNASNNFTYVWTPTGQTGNIINVIPNQTTTYTVEATETTEGCIATASKTVFVHTAPVLSIDVSSNNPICLGDEVSLTATIGGVNATDVVWTSPSLPTWVSINPMSVAPSLGTTEYTANVLYANDCSAMTSVTINTEDCCPARGNADYLQITDGTPPAVLAAYGIVQSGVNTFTVSSGQHHLFPNKVYIGDDVELRIVGAANATIVDVTNADVVMGRNSLIRVQGRGSIIAHNAVFRPCEEFQTWEGIQLDAHDGVLRATFNECTFVNAMTAINHNRPSDNGTPDAYVEITNNLFTNCAIGVRVNDGLNYIGSITGNTFKIDDNSEQTTYMNPTTTFRGIVVMRQNMQYPISQNDFVKGTNLTASTRFEGINLTGTAGQDISSNTFTNNDRAIVVLNSTNVSIENNVFEVTRRSTTDDMSYQLTLEGTTNTRSALVRANTFVNSASLREPSQAVDPISGLFMGAGAIYMSNEGHFTIDGNTIDGFEIGIFSNSPMIVDGPNSLSARIVNNHIKTHLFGIYARGFRWVTGNEAGQNVTLLVACNEIDMNLNALNGYEAIGLYFDPHHAAVGTTAGIDAVSTNVVIEGNCIKNTTTAVSFDYTNPNIGALPYFPVFRHNYLFNYTDVGLAVNNMQSIVATFPTPTNRISSNNTFISNNNAFDITANNAIVVSNNNHFGVGIANVNGDVTVTGEASPAATACGNQDLGAIEADVVLHCDNDNDEQILQVAQRLNQTGGLVLSTTYDTEFRALYQEDRENALLLAKGLMNNLVDIQEVDSWYQLMQTYTWTSNGKQWLAYYYTRRKGNYTAARQHLAQILANNQEEADKVVLERIYLNFFEQADAFALSNQEYNELNAIIAGNGSIKEAARNVLHLAQGKQPYQYASIKVALSQRRIKPIETPNGNIPFNLFPNPTKDQLNLQIQSKDLHFVKLSIYNVHGQLVKEQKIQAYQLALDVADFPQGVYAITLEDNTGRQFTEKFIKQ